MTMPALTSQFTAGPYREFLSPVAYGHLRECARSFSDSQYLSAAIWGAVFLEAFLSDLGRELGGPIDAENLEGQIGQLKSKIGQLKNKDKNHSIPDELFSRFREIQFIRNRLVHDTGLQKTTLAQDAALIVSALTVILESWRADRQRMSIAENIGKQATPLEHSADHIPVFLSTITPHLPEQEEFIQLLETRLKEMGISVVRLVFTQFDARDPLKKARMTIQSCRAAIVVGLERSHAYYICDNQGAKLPPKKEAEVMHRKYTSGWLHMEAAIANALDLPVFLLCQKEIFSDGIFDRNWNTYPLTELETLDLDVPQLRDFFAHLQQWVNNERTKVGNQKRLSEEI
jgi:hypothetical protein